MIRDYEAARVAVSQDEVSEGIRRDTRASEEVQDYWTVLKGYELPGKHMLVYWQLSEPVETSPTGCD